MILEQVDDFPQGFKTLDIIWNPKVDHLLVEPVPLGKQAANQSAPPAPHKDH